jgi:hypothetical protein
MAEVTFGPKFSAVHALETHEEASTYFVHRKQTSLGGQRKIRGTRNPSTEQVQDSTQDERLSAKRYTYLRELG